VSPRKARGFQDKSLSLLRAGNSIFDNEKIGTGQMSWVQLAEERVIYSDGKIVSYLDRSLR